MLLLGVMVVTGIGNYIVSVQVGKKMIKQTSKVSGIEALLKQFGIRNFSVSELSKMSDEGFNRLRVLLYDMKTMMGVGQPSGDNPLALIAALQQMGQTQQPSQQQVRTE